MSSKDIFEPESLNVRELFDGSGIRYKVPNYQRRYSWKRDQLDALWSDLYESFQNDPAISYFLGSIVVVENANGEFELVDGQQRITTLTILISVLLKTFPDINCINPDNPQEESTIIDEERLESCLYSRKGKKRLTLQTAVAFDSEFNKIVIEPQSFSDSPYPTKAEMKKDDPKFNFCYAVKFFYDKFTELEEDDRNRFVFYIFNRVRLIRIKCGDFSSAIKLFQVMNDRGMPLSAADIIKSYIMGRIDREEDKEHLGQVFSANWKSVETVVNQHDLTMDDFMVFYEYYKLKSNPKRQVVDELKDIIEDKNTDIACVVNELKTFADSLDGVLSKQDPVIYSLLYLPWPTYVKTILTAAYHVKYGVKTTKDNKPDESEQMNLFSLMRRYFYLAFISGKTLAQIKQTSFNILSAIIDKKPLCDINKILEDSISKYKMFKGTYEALGEEEGVYGENFLKPLLLSIEYDMREPTNTGFYCINRELHIDHILPQSFATEKKWDYINKEEAAKYIDTLGNMALLYYKKNEGALNKGFDEKCDIYLGLNKDGSSNNSGVTSFETTREITDVREKEKRTDWGVEDIKSRYQKLMGRVESLLSINQSMI